MSANYPTTIFLLWRKRRLGFCDVRLKYNELCEVELFADILCRLEYR